VHSGRENKLKRAAMKALNGLATAVVLMVSGLTACNDQRAESTVQARAAYVASVGRAGPISQNHVQVGEQNFAAEHPKLRDPGAGHQGRPQAVQGLSALTEHENGIKPVNICSVLDCQDSRRAYHRAEPLMCYDAP